MTKLDFNFKITMKYREIRRDDVFSVDYDLQARSVREALETAILRFGRYEEASSATWVRKQVGKAEVSILLDDHIIGPSHSAKIAGMLPDFDAPERVLLSEWLIYTDPVRADDAVSSVLAAEEDEMIRARIASLLGMEKSRPLRKSLQIALADPDGRVRANAIEAVQDIGRSDLLSMVVPLASDPNNRARANAVTAISALGDTELLDTLKQMMNSRDRWMRASAVYALGEMKDPEAVELLFGSLRADDDVVRFNGARAISKVFSPEMAEKLFLSMNYTDPLTSFTLHNILLGVGDDLIEVLKKYLQNPEYRESAEELLDLMAFKAFRQRRWIRFLRLAWRKGI